MKRAALALLLAACTARSSNAGPGGGSGDAGIDGGAGDAGALVTGRVCIVKDLRTPTACDPTGDASVIKVTLGTRTPVSPPARTGEFTIVAPSGTPVWHATGTTFVTSVMPYGTDNTIPIVPDTLYADALGASGVMILPAGQGSVLARVVSNGAPVANVQAGTTLTSTNVIPLYSTKNGLVWITTGPTIASGTVWFPGVDVTSAPGQITFAPQVGAAVSTQINVVEDQAITFVTQELQ